MSYTVFINSQLQSSDQGQLGSVAANFVFEIDITGGRSFTALETLQGKPASSFDLTKLRNRLSQIGYDTAVSRILPDKIRVFVNGLPNSFSQILPSLQEAQARLDVTAIVLTQAFNISQTSSTVSGATLHGSTQTLPQITAIIRNTTPTNPTGQTRTTQTNQGTTVDQWFSSVFGGATNAANNVSSNFWDSLGSGLGISTPFAILGAGLLVILLLRR